MEICQNKIKIKCIFVSLKGSDEPHDDVDSKCDSKIFLKMSFTVQIVKCLKVKQVRWIQFGPL